MNNTNSSNEHAHGGMQSHPIAHPNLGLHNRCRQRQKKFSRIVRLKILKSRWDIY